MPPPNKTLPCRYGHFIKYDLNTNEHSIVYLCPLREGNAFCVLFSPSNGWNGEAILRAGVAILDHEQEVVMEDGSVMGSLVTESNPTSSDFYLTEKSTSVLFQAWLILILLYRNQTDILIHTIIHCRGY